MFSWITLPFGVILVGCLAFYHLVVWRYFGWVFGILSLGSLALKQWGIWRRFVQITVPVEKVDTEKILQLNIFSKVDNRDIFVRFDFPKVDIFNRFTPFSFSKVYIFPKSLSGSTVARLFCTNLGSVVNSLFSNVSLHFISPLLYRFL